MRRDQYQALLNGAGTQPHDDAKVYRFAAIHQLPDTTQRLLDTLIAKGVDFGQPAGTTRAEFDEEGDLQCYWTDEKGTETFDWLFLADQEILWDAMLSEAGVGE